MDTVDIFESVDSSLSLFEKAQEREHLKPVKDLRDIVISSFKDVTWFNGFDQPS